MSALHKQIPVKDPDFIIGYHLCCKLSPTFENKFPGSHKGSVKGSLIVRSDMLFSGITRNQM